MLIEIAQALLDELFPPRCIHCHASGTILCASCLSTARAPRAPLCQVCGRSLPSAAVVCTICSAGHGPNAIASIRAAARHEGVVRDGVLALKYRGNRRLAEPLSALLAEAVRSAGHLPDVIVPVPLHIQRLRQRGYNQSELLARNLARRLGVPCETKVLVRRRATPPQLGLSGPERRTNVADAFVLSGSAARHLVGRRVLLVDDVITTGSTLDAAASALLDASPAELHGLALSRPDSADDSRDASWSAGSVTPGLASHTRRGRRDS